MRSGKSKSTIKDVAQAAGVSIATVSRVINGLPSVNPEARDRVLEAIAHTEYRPNLVARSMRAGESKTLAFVVRDFSGAGLSALADAVQKEVGGLGFSLFVASSYHDRERELFLLRDFKSRRVDGMVIATSSEVDEELLRELAGPSAPAIVLLDRAAPERLDAVQADHAGGLRQAVDYLVSLGHRRIALITGEPDVSPTTDRIRGYQDALRQHGLALEPDLCRSGSFSASFGYEQALSLLAAEDRPTAVIAGGTAMLTGTLRAARELGLSIPQDISIIAGAESDLALFTTPTVTVIRWDYDSLGRTAGRFLATRIAEPEHPRQRRLFPTELVVRGSCAPLPGRKPRRRETPGA